MNWLDQISIASGVLVFIFFLFTTTGNNYKFSGFQVILANIKLKRGWKLLLSFMSRFGFLYLYGFILLSILFTNNEILRINQFTSHIPIPFFSVFILSQLNYFIVNKILKIFIKPDSISNPIKLLVFLNESTLNFWVTSFRFASTFYAKTILENKNNLPIITMLYEKKKLEIAFSKKSRHLLEIRNVTQKVHYLMEYYGYETLIDLLNNKNFKSLLQEDFSTKGTKWDGTERRRSGRVTKRGRRIEDQKHIAKAIDESKPK